MLIDGTKTTTNISFIVCSVSIPTFGKGSLTLLYKNTLPSLVVPVVGSPLQLLSVSSVSDLGTTAVHPLWPYSLVQRQARGHSQANKIKF